VNQSTPVYLRDNENVTTSGERMILLPLSSSSVTWIGFSIVSADITSTPVHVTHETIIPCACNIQGGTKNFIFESS